MGKLVSSPYNKYRSRNHEKAIITINIDTWSIVSERRKYTKILDFDSPNNLVSNASRVLDKDAPILLAVC